MNIKNKKKIIQKKILNKKAYFNFYIEKKIVAGIQLQGWEVKAIRSGKVQITNGYITIKNQEVFLINVNLQLLSTSSIFKTDQINREKKLLLNKKEIIMLSEFYNIKGYSIIPLKLFWIKSWCKIKIGIARGKNIHDKRMDEKKRLWNRDKKIFLQEF
ncbi:tmRNA-binding protein [Buchnera aphidicola (Cinara tujafilina)]|uniref:SsrA-binding protein n=1 Tax=Buchnera aphidicola (Cinara tujafilina) TaxID=261317 RepID=F7WZ95_9GAMM|nr:SsrA-binding protein SmpB [Buchnera aphidicola]AEH39749.1 tmRNA-binding protein [Buchnera aphidicola (Cinara tujafilina)]